MKRVTFYVVDSFVFVHSKASLISWLEATWLINRNWKVASDFFMPSAIPINIIDRKSVV